MTELERKLIENTLRLVENSRKNHMFIGDPVLLQLYITIVETCDDREDRKEIIQMLIDARADEVPK